MTKRARIAVVGTGWWASDTHIPALLARDDAELVALCDSDNARLNAAAITYDIKATYTKLDTMLQNEELEGVVVASSNASHYQLVKACLEHKLHVMVEKPMTLRAMEARELLELAKEQKRELIVGYPYNFTSIAKRIHNVLSSGELGGIQYINGTFNSMMTPFFSGNFPFDYRVHEPTQYLNPEQIGGGHGQVQLTHLAGLLFFLTDLQAKQITAMMEQHQFEVDLVNAMAIAFEGGALGTLGGTGNQQGSTFRLIINCEKGWIDMDAGLHYAKIYQQDKELETLNDEPNERLGFVTANNLVDVILAKAKAGSPAKIGLRAVELLEAAYLSAAQGNVVHVKELYEDN